MLLQMQAKLTTTVKQVYYLARSDLCNASYTDVKELSSLYNHTLTSLLGVHAPLQGFLQLGDYGLIMKSKQ